VGLQVYAARDTASISIEGDAEMPYKDPDKKREQMRVWRAKNPDKVRANDLRDRKRQHEYRKAHLAQYAEYQRNRRLKYPQEALVNQAKSRAKKFGLPFNLSVETMKWPTHCPILKMELDYNKTNPGSRVIRHSVPTLDRKVNELGYVLGNVFVISHRANRIKSDATATELRAVLAYMEQ
jgi:hypothetical protein